MFQPTSFICLIVYSLCVREREEGREGERKRERESVLSLFPTAWDPGMKFRASVWEQAPLPPDSNHQPHTPSLLKLHLGEGGGRSGAGRWPLQCYQLRASWHFPSLPAGTAESTSETSVPLQLDSEKEKFITENVVNTGRMPSAQMAEVAVPTLPSTTVPGQWLLLNATGD